MKKTLSVLLALMLVLSLTACGSKQKEVKIGVAIYQFDDNFMTLYRHDIEDYFKKLSTEECKYTVTIVDGKNDQATQTEQVETFINQGVDGLIVNLVQTSADALAKKVEESGIPCVFINREIANYAYGKKTCYVGADARDSGTYQGQLIFDCPAHGDLNGDGTVKYMMIMGDPENSDAKFRTEFSIKYLVDQGVKVERVAEDTTGMWDQAQGQEIAANTLNAHPEVEVIFCNNDAMALGAAQAIKAAGRTVGKDIYLVGVDALADACTLVKNGEMTGTVLNDDLGQATACCDSLVKMLAGEEITTKVNYVPYVKVTTENVDNYL